MKRTHSILNKAFIAILLLTAALFLYAIGYKSPDNRAYIGSFSANELSDGWTYTGADGETAENLSLPLSVSQKAGDTYYLRNRLPEDVRDGMRISVRALRQDVTIYVDGEARSVYHAESASGLKRSSESAFVLADLYDADAGAEIVLEVTPHHSEAIRFPAVTYAYGNNVWFPLIEENIAIVLVAVILILAGLLSIFAYFLMRKKMLSLRTLLHLAETMVIAGMWMLGESEIRQLIFYSPSYSSVFSFLLMDLIRPFAMMYFNEVQERRYEKVYTILECGMLFQIVLNSILNFSGVASYYDLLLYSHIWSALAILWAVATLVVDIRTGKVEKYSMTAFGMLFMLACGMAEIVNFYTANSIGFGVFLGIGLLALLGATAMQVANDELARVEQAQMADHANRAKSSFLANMSHEIRTPINAILGMDEMILRESGEGSIVSYAEDIQSAGKTLLSIVNDILDFSKIEEGKMEILPTQYDLGSVINDLVNMTRARAEKKNLHFSVKVDETMPHLLHGDEIRIRQCALNLLTNAVKYTETGSVTLDVGYHKLSDDEIALSVRVSDTGIGMKAEDMERLFSPFARIEEMRNRNIEGTGLGMSITKQLLAMMGSRLDVESVYGEGSTFSFEIAQGVVRWEPIGSFADRYKTYASRETYRELFQAPQARVLVVDDTPVNLAVISGLLKKTRVQVVTAGSGKEALAKVAHKTFDVLFIDHMMPEMDGIETLHELKKLPGYENIPTVALTANAISGAREMYLEAGFSDYLSKPVDSEALEKVLLSLLPEEKVKASAANAASLLSTESGKPTVLVADDDPTICALASDILGKDFRVETCQSGAETPHRAEALRPDLILLDINFGDASGFDVLRALRAEASTDDIPVVFLTGASDEEAEVRGFRDGAADFVRKPFVPEVLLRRISRIIALTRLQRDLQSEVRHQTLRAEHLTREMMLALSRAIDAKDHYTSGHSERVAAYSAEIARRMGKSSAEQEHIYEMGLLHDIGKIGVPEEIINKTSRLPDEEFERIKRHTVIGSEILRLITEMPELAVGARSHHERFDGTGYPDGLKGANIPEAARIICLADCYDAMTSTRTYSQPKEQAVVRAEIERCAGAQFDPDIAKVLLAMIDEDKDYMMTERTADIHVWKGSERLWTLTGEQSEPTDYTAAQAPAELPEWLEKIDEINTDEGLRYCGTVDTYLDALTIFVTNLPASLKEITDAQAAHDTATVIVKVHAFKSTSRAIGAKELGALAEKLELAGKAGDTNTLEAELPGLLERFRVFGEALSPLLTPDPATQDDESLPIISDEQLREAYDSIREFSASLDSDSAAYIMDYLSGFRIPDGERERVAQLRGAIRSFDWDRIAQILT